MKHWIYRVSVGIVAVLMLVSLCACTPATGTTTTVGDVTTTTLATDPTDDVTDPSDDVTEPTEGDTNPTEGDTDPTQGATNSKPQQTLGSAVITVAGNSADRDRPWQGATAPERTTVVTTTEVTTEKSYATLPKVERNEKYVNPTGIQHLLPAYTYTDVYSKSVWLPSVGYVKDGEVLDTMFDTFLILPSPQQVYNGTLSTKRSWDKWREHTYKNLETLNEAVIEVQEALNLKEYKVKVTLTIVPPNVSLMSNWGELNGQSLACRNDDENFEMVKYMVDSYIAEFKEQNYSNLVLNSFYWFDEFLETAHAAYYMKVTDYIRSTGYYSVHAPYFKSRGWQYSKIYGFDATVMQSNYFHNRPYGQGASGQITNIAENIGYVLDGTNHGIVVEANAIDGDEGQCDMTTVKITLKTALEKGISDAPHFYYYGGGATYPYKMSRHSDEYINSTYHELYKYFHNKLTPEDIWLEDFAIPHA